MLCKIWLKKSFISNKGEVGIVLETAHIKMDKTGFPTFISKQCSKSRERARARNHSPHHQKLKRRKKFHQWIPMDLFLKES